MSVAEGLDDKTQVSEKGRLILMGGGHMSKFF